MFVFNLKSLENHSIAYEFNKLDLIISDVCAIRIES